MTPWLPLIFGVIIALLGTFVTFLYTLSLKRRDERVGLGRRVDHLENQVEKLELKMAPLWRVIEEHIGDFLKRPTHHAMDALIEKLRQRTITLDECYELRRWLHEVYLKPEIPPSVHKALAALYDASVEAFMVDLKDPTP